MLVDGEGLSLVDLTSGTARERSRRLACAGIWTSVAAHP